MPFKQSRLFKATLDAIIEFHGLRLWSRLANDDLFALRVPEERHPLFTDPGKELNLLLWNLLSGGEEEVQLGVPLQAAVSWIVWCYPGMTEERFYDAFSSFWERRFSVEDLLWLTAILAALITGWCG